MDQANPLDAFRGLNQEQIVKVGAKANLLQDEITATLDELKKPATTDFGKQLAQIIGTALPGAISALAGGDKFVTSGLLSAGGTTLDTLQAEDRAKEEGQRKLNQLLEAKGLSLKQKELTDLQGQLSDLGGSERDIQQEAALAAAKAQATLPFDILKASAGRPVTKINTQLPNDSIAAPASVIESVVNRFPGLNGNERKNLSETFKNSNVTLSQLEELAKTSQKIGEASAGENPLIEIVPGFNPTKEQRKNARESSAVFLSISPSIKVIQDLFFSGKIKETDISGKDVQIIKSHLANIKLGVINLEKRGANFTKNEEILIDNLINVVSAGTGFFDAGIAIFRTYVGRTGTTGIDTFKGIFANKIKADLGADAFRIRANSPSISFFGIDETDREVELQNARNKIIEALKRKRK